MSLKRRGAREGAREATPPCNIQMLSERKSNSEKWKMMILAYKKSRCQLKLRNGSPRNYI